MDDQKQIRSALRRLLKNERFECFFAASVDEAFSIVDQKGIQVVLSDIFMPGIDGIAFLKKIAETNPGIIRLAISADSGSQTVIKALNQGNILRYITKPWNDTELVHVLRQAFELYNLKQEKRDLIKQLQDHNFELEKQVEQRTRELCKTYNAAEIGKHASQIVHNLNNPLNGVSGALELIEVFMEESPWDMPRIKQYLVLAKSQIKDMGQIISSILAHIQHHEIDFKESIDLNELIKAEIKLYEINPVFKYQIKKKLLLDESLPTIEGNRIHIKQVLDNLIKNAIDAMEHSVNKNLILETAYNGQSIIIRIKDSGCGISKEEIGRIFLPGFTTKPLGKGTGLGLASAKTMVEGYQGSLNVDSLKGKGTTFTLSLPINQSVRP